MISLKRVAILDRIIENNKLFDRFIVYGGLITSLIVTFILVDFDRGIIKNFFPVLTITLGLIASRLTAKKNRLGPVLGISSDVLMIIVAYAFGNIGALGISALNIGFRTLALVNWGNLEKSKNETQYYTIKERGVKFVYACLMAVAVIGIYFALNKAFLEHVSMLELTIFIFGTFGALFLAFSLKSAYIVFIVTASLLFISYNGSGNYVNASSILFYNLNNFWACYYWYIYKVK